MCAHILLVPVPVHFRDLEISLKGVSNRQMEIVVCVFFKPSFISFFFCFPPSLGGKSPGQVVVLDQTKGDQGHTRTVRRGRFDKVSIYRFDAILT